MPLPNLPVPEYPNVPNVPGVPPLARAPGTSGNVLNTISIATADAAQVLQMLGITSGPQWGIFDETGTPLLIADTVLGVEYHKDFREANYPIEGGSFANYNKVELPFDIRVAFGVGGAQSLVSNVLNTVSSGGSIGAIITGGTPSRAARADFLAALDAAAKSLDLVLVVTPEETYPSCNIVHTGYNRRVEDGVTLIIIDVWLTEIRISPAAQNITVNGQSQPVQGPATADNPTGNAQSADGAPTTNNGTVQPTNPGGSTGAPGTTPNLGTGAAPLTSGTLPDGSPIVSTPGFLSGPDPITLPNGTVVPPNSITPNPDGTPYVQQ